MTAEWGVPTPSGHIYHEPTSVSQARQRSMDFAQGCFERWDDAECVADPTWDVVSILLDEVERLRTIPMLAYRDYNVAQDDPRTNSGFPDGTLEACTEILYRMAQVQASPLEHTHNGDNRDRTRT